MLEIYLLLGLFISSTSPLPHVGIESSLIRGQEPPSKGQLNGRHGSTLEPSFLESQVVRYLKDTPTNSLLGVESSGFRDPVDQQNAPSAPNSSSVVVHSKILNSQDSVKADSDPEADIAQEHDVLYAQNACSAKKRLNSDSSTTPLTRPESFPRRLRSPCADHPTQNYFVICTGKRYGGTYYDPHFVLDCLPGNFCSYVLIIVPA